MMIVQLGVGINRSDDAPTRHRQPNAAGALGRANQAGNHCSFQQFWWLLCFEC